MQKTSLFLSLATLMTLGTVLPGAADAAPTPCEQMLKQVRTAMTTAQLSATEMDKAKASEQQGLDRCKADDDAGADQHFAEALKLLGKQ